MPSVQKQTLSIYRDLENHLVELTFTVQSKLIKSLNDLERRSLFNCIKKKEVDSKLKKVILKKLDFINKKTPKITREKTYRSRLSVRIKSIKIVFFKFIYRFFKISSKQIEVESILKKIRDKGSEKGKPVTFSELAKLLEGNKNKKKINLKEELKKSGFPNFIYKQSFPQNFFNNVDINGLKFFQCEFYNHEFSDKKFNGVEFDHCQFTHAGFSGAKIKDVNFKFCEFNNCMLSGVHLSNVRFIGDEIIGCDFEDAIIDKCEFNRVKMPATHFLDAKVKNTKISNSNLKNTVFFETFDYFKIDEETKKTHEIKKPICAILASPLTIGFSSPKIFIQADRAADTIPIRINFKPRVADRKKLNFEIENILNQIEDPSSKDKEKKSDDVESIPMQILSKLKKDSSNYPESHALLNKIRHLSSHVDGFILPGGEDVPPALYGEKTDAKTDPVNDYRRSIMEFAIINESMTRGIPLMGICRGFQIVNVFFGAKLSQDVKGQFGLQNLHKKRSGNLNGLYTSVFNNKILTPSFHHQGVNIDHFPVKKFKPIIVKDSLVKASEYRLPISSPMFLLQFHPEFASKINVGKNFISRLKYAFLSPFMSSNNTKLFGLFSDSTKAYRNKKLSMKCVKKNIGDKIKARSKNKKRKVKKISYCEEGFLVVESTIKYYLRRVVGLSKGLFLKLFNLKKGDSNNIVSSNIYEAKKHHWNLNNALLNELDKKTTDGNGKNKIEFLKRLFLHKIASLHDSILEISKKGASKKFNFGKSQEHTYYRTHYGKENIRVAKKYNEKLAFRNKTPLILTDTTEFSKIISSCFNLIIDDFDKCKDLITDKLSRKGSFKSINDFIKSNEKNKFVFDLTERLKNLIKVNDGNDQMRFEKEFVGIKKQIQASIEDVVTSFCSNHPQLFKRKSDRDKLRKFIENNSICISRVKFNDNISGVKILPLFSKCEHRTLLKNSSFFTLFMERSGLYINPLNKLRYLNEKEKTDGSSEYRVKGQNNNKTLFAQVPKFSDYTIWKDLNSRLLPRNIKKLPQKVIGIATLKILNGLFKDIDENSWKKLNENNLDRVVMENSIYKILNSLSNAALYLHDFNRFSNEMELISCEISTLLEIIRPYHEGDFKKVYRENIDELIPDKLKEHVKVGLGKTAANVFAGIHAASFQSKADPVTAHSEGFYFEQKRLMGSENKFTDLIENKLIENVDLYVGEANPNISVWKGATRYNYHSIESDIESILGKKKKTDHLTVAVDVTIDYAKSSDIKNLLERFSDEIASGKLNFVFFRSGQKFDMLGMDNYYGSPFFTVNNNDKQWEFYNKIFDAPVHKTDPLSAQWFTLSNKYAYEEIDQYRKLIFENSREILSKIPKALRSETGHPTDKLRINTVDDKMLVSFIDIKIPGRSSIIKAGLICSAFVRFFAEKGIMVQDRHSFGFIHSNISIIPDKNCTSIRINPGINPLENQAMVDFLSSLK